MSALVLNTLIAIENVPPFLGRLFGTVKFAGNPESPAQARIQLFTSQNAHNQVFPLNTALRWVLTDTDGAYAFENIDPAIKYHVIAYDPTGQYDPVIKMNLVPTVD